MSDIINSVKEEILRLADKQAAAQVGKAQQVAAHYRSEAIELRRLVKQQEKEIKYLKKQVPVEQPEDAQLEGVRFSAKSVKSQRRRLGLSCEQYGKFGWRFDAHDPELGVWEVQTSPPATPRAGRRS